MIKIYYQQINNLVHCLHLVYELLVLKNAFLDVVSDKVVSNSDSIVACIILVANLFHQLAKIILARCNISGHHELSQCSESLLQVVIDFIKDAIKWLSRLVCDIVFE